MKSIDKPRNFLVAGSLALALAALLLAAPCVVSAEVAQTDVAPQSAAADGDDPEAGMLALGAAATVAWVALLLLVVHQYRRQRQLVGEMEEMKRSLDALERSQDQGAS